MNDTKETNTASLKADWDRTSEDLVKMLSSLIGSQLITVPFEGSWTAAQVYDHLLKSLSGVVGTAVFGKTENTEREPDAYVENLRSAFLNFDIKMQSPPFILPDDKSFTKEELQSRLLQSIHQINKAFDMPALYLSCMDFEMPGVGVLTRWEWLNFAVVHAQRHAHQLKNIIHHLL